MRPYLFFDGADGVSKIALWGVAGVIIDGKCRLMCDSFASFLTNIQGTRRGLFGTNSDMDPVTGGLIRSWRESPNVEVRPPPHSQQPGILTRRSVLLDRSHCDGRSAGAHQTQCHISIPARFSHQQIFPLLFIMIVRALDCVGHRFSVRQHLPVRDKAVGVLGEHLNHQRVLRRYRRRQCSTVLFRFVSRRLDPCCPPVHDLEDEVFCLEEGSDCGRVRPRITVDCSSSNTCLYHVVRRIRYEAFLDLDDPSLIVSR